MRARKLENKPTINLSRDIVKEAFVSKESKYLRFIRKKRCVLRNLGANKGWMMELYNKRDSLTWRDVKAMDSVKINQNVVVYTKDKEQDDNGIAGQIILDNDSDRQFVLICKTKQERENWLNVLKLKCNVIQEQ